MADNMTKNLEIDSFNDKDSVHLQSVNILTLPDELLEKIFSYMNFDDISSYRLVCQKFNKVSQTLLNNGLLSVEKLHQSCLKEIKGQLPRRESERRTHPLSRHVDILSAIETRLSLLGMTYGKYIERGYCCFIPGKVLDEIYHVLDVLKSTKSPPRAHELLQELRDISSMAMEHFEEKISPRLRKLVTPTKTIISQVLTDQSHNHEGDQGDEECDSPSTSLTLSSCIRWSPLKQGLMKSQKQLRFCSTNIVSIKKELNEYKNTATNQGLTIAHQQKKIVEQSQKILLQSQKIKRQDKRLNDLTMKMTEYDQVFDELIGVLNGMRKDSRIQTIKEREPIKPSASDSSSPTKRKMCSGLNAESKSKKVRK